MHRQLYSCALAQLAEMPVFLRRTLAGLSREALLRQPRNDRSPLLEHLWHTRDCDSDLYGLRIRRIVAEDRPLLEPVDVGAWRQARGYDLRAGDPAIAEFELERARLIDELKSLHASELQRVGVRADGSEVSVMDVIRQLAEHDQDHRWRIAAILREFGDSAASGA